MGRLRRQLSLAGASAAAAALAITVSVIWLLAGAVVLDQQRRIDEVAGLAVGLPHQIREMKPIKIPGLSKKAPHRGGENSSSHSEGDQGRADRPSGGDTGRDGGSGSAAPPGGGSDPGGGPGPGNPPPPVEPPPVSPPPVSPPTPPTIPDPPSVPDVKVPVPQLPDVKAPSVHPAVDPTLDQATDTVNGIKDQLPSAVGVEIR